MEQENSYDDLFEEGENRPVASLWGRNDIEGIIRDVSYKEIYKAGRQGITEEAEIKEGR